MLIILRGNSGSGKSTVAELLRKKLTGPVAVLSQDYFQRAVFAEEGTAGMAHARLIEAAAVHCLDAGEHVVLDGIFNAPRYEAYLARIVARTADARLYAFDLTFDETVRRHATRTKSADFDEDEMRSWYHGWQPLSFAEERRITASEAAEDVADRILREGPSDLRSEPERRL